MIAPEQISWPDGIDAQQFLDRYWQKQPLLIKQAFAQFDSPISPEELAGLAIEEDTTPRLIIQDDNGHYQLENGPFAADRFTTLTDNNWSLLVTDVEKYLPGLADYLRPFQFIPNWRIDDLMISYAPVGASVGAHVDEYDVFLLQASGTRRWMIDASDSPDLSLVPDANLKLLANFNTSDTYELEPGDMLYLPPGMPHHGIATGDNCTTWSIGFRAPTVADTIQSFAEMVAGQFGDQRYKDPALTECKTGELDAATLNSFKALWQKATALDDQTLAIMTGRLLTTSAIDTERTAFNPDTVKQERWQKHSFSRLAYTSREGVTTLFADGEAFDCSENLAKALCDNQSVHASELNNEELWVLEELVELGSLLPVMHEG